MSSHVHISLYRTKYPGQKIEDRISHRPNYGFFLVKFTVQLLRLQFLSTRNMHNQAEAQHRVEICRDRHDQRSCKICASCVNFPGNHV